jgi:hypothetical protein
VFCIKIIVFYMRLVAHAITKIIFHRLILLCITPVEGINAYRHKHAYNYTYISVNVIL